MQVWFPLDLPKDDGPAAGRRITPLRFGVAVAAVAIIVAAAVVAGTRGGGSGQPLMANAVATLGGSGSVERQIPIPSGGRPAAITAGAGAIWVIDAGRAVADKVDPAAGAIQNQTQPLGRAPSGVAVGGGGLWVSDAAGSAVRWVSLNALTQTAASIPVGQGPGPIAYGDGAAWVINSIDGTLQRLTGPNDKPSSPVPVGTDPTALTVAAASVWVTDAAANTVERLDRNMRGTDRIAVGNGPDAITAGGGAVWIASVDGTVTRVDPTSDGTRTVTVGGRPAGIAFAGGNVWVAIADPSSVARIDPMTLSVKTTTLASPPAAITALGDRAWIASVASPASHRGGTLRVLFGPTTGGESPFASGFHPYDPGAAPFLAHFSLLHLTNDGLVALRRIGGVGGLQLVPDLAVAPPAISGDGRTYTFRLRRGIHYSNGDLVKPSDFLFAMTREFEHQDVTYGPVFFANIVGASRCGGTPGECAAALAKGIQPNDKAGTLTIHLVNPDSGFLYELATTFGSLLPPDSPAIDSGKPVPATGPYIVTQTGGRSITLERNPRFLQWSADAQPGGFAETIRFTFAPDRTALTEVEHGEADVLLNQPPSDRLAELRTRYAVLAHPYVELATHYLGFNVRAPPFSSLAARQAVNFGVDRNQPTRLALSSVQSPTCQVLPPTMFGYSPYCPYTRDPNPISGAWRGPDLARARALVEQSRTRGDPVQVWSCTCLGIPGSEGGYVTRLLRSLGYRATDHSTGDYNLYHAAVKNSHLPVVYIESWFSDYPSPTDFFALLLCSSQADIAYCDPALDALVGRAQRATGQPARQIWEEADRRAVDQAAWVPLTNSSGIDVVGAHVGNYQHNPQLGVLLDQLWVR